MFGHVFLQINYGSHFIVPISLFFTKPVNGGRVYAIITDKDDNRDRKNKKGRKFDEKEEGSAP